MVKRTADAQRAADAPPPAKRTRNRGDVDAHLGVEDVAQPLDIPSKAEGSQADSSETDRSGQTTPPVWEKTDEEAVNDAAPAAKATPSAAIKPIPAPDLNDVSTLFEHIDYVPDDGKHRLLSFAQKKDDTNLRYAIATVPSHAKWGSTSKSAKVLCIDDKPITIWAVGDVETTWFRDLQGNPHDRVNIGFRLPFALDEKGLERLFSRARPARQVDDLTYASKRMTVYRKGDTFPTILPFTNIYDARKRFQAKSQMATLETSNIGKRDIVLVEGKFTRWNAAKDKKNKRDWKLWDVGFELEAVSLLYESPLDADPAPTNEVEDFEDDM